MFLVLVFLESVDPKVTVAIQVYLECPVREESRYTKSITKTRFVSDNYYRVIRAFPDNPVLLGCLDHLRRRETAGLTDSLDILVPKGIVDKAVRLEFPAERETPAYLEHL